MFVAENLWCPEHIVHSPLYTNFVVIYFVLHVLRSLRNSCQSRLKGCAKLANISQPLLLFCGGKIIRVIYFIVFLLLVKRTRGKIIRVARSCMHACIATPTAQLTRKSILSALISVANSRLSAPLIGRNLIGILENLDP